MVRKQGSNCLALFIIAASFTSAYARATAWFASATPMLTAPRDHDSIEVGRSDGTFRAIQLRVSGGAVNFDGSIVRYGNGTQEEIAVRNRIPDGGHTRIIDLPGDRRIIQSVDLWYGKDRCGKTTYR